MKNLTDDSAFEKMDAPRVSKLNEKSPDGDKLLKRLLGNVGVGSA
jgi:hypothetical protein